MKRLLLSDIHANLPALEAVLQDAGTADEVWVMGDLVGFGPNPKECLHLLRQIGAVCVLGNHDIGLTERKPDRPLDFSWDEWTWQVLGDEYRSFLFSLPEWRIMEDGSVLMHEFPPFSADGSWKTPRMLRENLPGLQGSRVLFGHVHYYTACSLQGKDYLSVPAVGQQRNGSPDAQYLVEENGRITHHTVPYDVARLVYDLKSIGPDFAASPRWIHFAETGYDAEWSYRVPDVLRQPPFPELPLFADTCPYD